MADECKERGVQCMALEDLLSLYAEDPKKLTNGERALVCKHLAICEGCRVSVQMAKVTATDLERDFEAQLLNRTPKGNA